MATVCALNNYPLEKMWALARAGAMPRQHLWGVDALAAAGHTVEFAPFHEPEDRAALERLSRRTRGALGHLDQEAYALRRLRRLDALYCADQTGLAGLALAGPLLPRRRLISVIHHPIRNPLRQRAAAGHDVLVCLSGTLRHELERDLGHRRARVVEVSWGPDLASPLYRPDGEGNGVVSAGKSNRDVQTLAAALGRTGAPGLLYDLERQLASPPSDAVRLVHPGQRGGVDPDSPGGFLARHVIADIAAAAIVAIPVRDPARLTGLTEAVDALALAKPIVATRSPYFPFDIEAVGCGIWVEPGDADGWARAIAQLQSDQAIRTRMGAAGRAYAERECNYDAFAARLVELIDA